MGIDRYLSRIYVYVCCILHLPLLLPPIRSRTFNHPALTNLPLSPHEERNIHTHTYLPIHRHDAMVRARHLGCRCRCRRIHTAQYDSQFECSLPVDRLSVVGRYKGNCFPCNPSTSTSKLFQASKQAHTARMPPPRLPPRLLLHTFPQAVLPEDTLPLKSFSILHSAFCNAIHVFKDVASRKISIDVDGHCFECGGA